MKSLSWCKNPDEALKMFRDVKLWGTKKLTGGISVADSLAISERDEKSAKRAANLEA